MPAKYTIGQVLFIPIQDVVLPFRVVEIRYYPYDIGYEMVELQVGGPYLNSFLESQLDKIGARLEGEDEDYDFHSD